MNIIITADCFTAGHTMLSTGTRINLPLADAMPLITAGRAQTADEAAANEVKAYINGQMRQADRLNLGRLRPGQR